MQKATGIGKNVEKAIANALEQLDCKQDEVTIKVISEGGLFKKAEVEVTRDEAIEKATNEAAYDSKSKEEPKAELKPQPKVETKKTEPKAMPKKEEPKTMVQTAAKPTVKTVTKTEEKSHQKAEPHAKPFAAANQKAVVKAEAVENLEVIKEFLTKLISFTQKPNIVIDINVDQDAICVDMNGEGLANFIGTSGSTLFAIETIVNVVAQQNGIKSKRIVLDIGGYKKGKVQKLYEIADKAAAKVLETGEQYKMRPMPARERRAIHSYLQDKPGIKTVSKGDEPNRFLIVQKSE